MAHRRTTRRVAKPGDDIHDQPTVVEPDEYEFEEPSPPPRRSGRGSALNHDEDVPVKSGNFKLRWFSAMFGFLGAWMLFIGLQWEILEPSWLALFEASGNPAWQHYTLFALGAFFGSLGLCLFLALIDKSAFRNFISGTAWFALVTVLLNLVFLLEPQPPVDVKESIPAATEMIRMSLMPGIAASEREIAQLNAEFDRAKQKLKESDEEIKVQKASNDGLVNSLENSKKELAQAQVKTLAAEKQQQADKATINELKEDVAALKVSLDAKDKDLVSASEKLTAAGEAAEKHQEQLNKRDEQIEAHAKEITVLKESLSKTKKELQRTKDMAAMEKMGNNPTPLKKAPGLE